MHKHSIPALVLIVFMGWTGQSAAQQIVERATIPSRLLSIGKLLLNPNSPRQPVPLFGYRAHIFDDRGGGGTQADGATVDLNALIAEVRAGRVRLAVVTRHGAEPDIQYIGRGILDVNDVSNQIRTMENSGSDNLLALTRPLRGIEAAGEFISDSSLWLLPTQSSSPRNENDASE